MVLLVLQPAQRYINSDLSSEIIDVGTANYTGVGTISIGASGLLGELRGNITYNTDNTSYSCIYNNDIITNISCTLTLDATSQGIGINNDGGTIIDITGIISSGFNIGTGIRQAGTIGNISGTVNATGSSYAINVILGYTLSMSGGINVSGGAQSIGINNAGSINISGTIIVTSGSTGINNYSGTIIDISGTITVNGGIGINNDKTIDNISGYLYANGDSYGIINNSPNGVITNITGAITVSDSGYGITNYGTITDISGIYPKGLINSGFSAGIDNNGTIANITGTVTNNNGVGIINNATIQNISGTINNNSNGIENYGTIEDITGIMNNTGNGTCIYNGSTILNISGTINCSGATIGFENANVINNISGILNLSQAAGGIINYGTLLDVAGTINAADTSIGIMNNGPITNISGTINVNGSICYGIYSYGACTIHDVTGHINVEGTGSTAIYLQDIVSQLLDMSGVINIISGSNTHGIQNNGVITDITGIITNSSLGTVPNDCILNDAGTITNISGHLINTSPQGGCINNNTGTMKTGQGIGGAGILGMV